MSLEGSSSSNIEGLGPPLVVHQLGTKEVAGSNPGKGQFKKISMKNVKFEFERILKLKLFIFCSHHMKLTGYFNDLLSYKPTFFNHSKSGCFQI